MIFSRLFQFFILLILLHIFIGCKKDEAKQAALSISKDFLAFNNREALNTFTITNTGNSELNFEITTDVSEVEIKLSVSSGVVSPSQKKTIVIEANISDLNEGTFIGEVKIISNGGNKDIAVLVVKNPVELSFFPLNIYTNSSKTSDTISVINTSTDTITYNLETNNNWIIIDNQNNSILPLETQYHIITYNTLDLNEGIHSGYINAKFNNENTQINISLDVIKVAILETNYDQMSFSFDKIKDTIEIFNIGNDTLYFEINSPNDWIHLSKLSDTIAPKGNDEIEIHIDENVLGTNQITGKINITSNGGEKNIDLIIDACEPPLLFTDVDYLKIPNNIDKDYINISNQGEAPLDYKLTSPVSWITFSANEGTLKAGEEIKIWLNINRNGLSPNLYSSVVNIISNGGEEQITVDMEVEAYSVTFFNPTYTPIEIETTGFGYTDIPVLGRINFVFQSNPESITYFARTEGETYGGQTLGLILFWDETINLSNETSPIYILNISDYFFFMSAQNYGNHDLDMWSINYDTEYQFDEDVLIPNDGYEYKFGYYDALENSTIYSRIVGTPYDAVWENGVEFDFPWTMNQAILLESDQKKSGNVKSNRFFNKTGETQSAIQVQPRTQEKIRTRNSQSLTNKRK